MSNYDDQDFNDDEEFSEDDMAEFEKRLKEEDEKLKAHPLYVQALENLHILELLLDSAAKSSGKEVYEGTLRESAVVIIAKLSSGLRTDSFVLAMQCAAIIRDHAEYLRLSNHMLKNLEGFDANYVQMFRNEMEKFRLLFKTWAGELHKMEADYQDEDWGLFIK